MSQAFLQASPAKTVSVAARLFYKQRAVGYLVASFLGSSLLSLGILWVAGPTTYALLLAVLLFFLLPFILVYAWRASYIKPALLSFTPEGLYLEANEEHYQVAWADLVAFQVHFILGKMIGDGYRLKLQCATGQSIVFNLLEHQLVNPTNGVRPDSALAALCRYIGWHNRQATGGTTQIALRPGLLARKTGVVLLAGLGALVAADLGFRMLHPAISGETVGLLAGAVALALQVLGQKKNDDRYSRYLRTLQDQGPGF
jgi:hypothetical protein